MFKRILNSLTKNLGLKLVSLIGAVILWLIVVNYDNPQMTTSFQVPVTVQNESVLEEMGKVYDIVDGSNVATIYVTGKRSYVDSLSASDFLATADLSQIDFHNENEQKIVHIDVTPKRYEKFITISQKTMNMRVTIEDLTTSQKYIACETKGMPVEGYAIGEVAVTPSLIKISGPQSVVDRISRVVAVADVEGLARDFTDNVPLVLYDEEGRTIESSQLRLSQSTVTVSVEILATKTVPLRCQVSGTPAEGYYYEGLEYAPESVTIKGKANVLNNITEILIPGEAINVEGATADVEKSIDLTPYVEQKGVSLVNQEENKIAVKALILRMGTKTLELPVTEIVQRNLPTGYEASYLDNRITINVRGRSEDLEKLTVDQVKAVVDLRNVSPGTQAVPVEITLDDKYRIVGTVNVQMQIRNKAEEDDRNGGDQDSDDNDGTDGNSGNGTDDNGGDSGNDDNSRTGNDSAIIREEE